MQCEMCGNKSFSLYKTIIEGTSMNLCQNCSGFGKRISEVKEVTQKEKKKQQLRNEKIEDVKDVLFRVRDDYARIIRMTREKSGLTNEEFAKKINEKESLISHIENGKTTPSLVLARKLEKNFGIKLIEEYEEKHQGQKQASAGMLTLGDLIKFKEK